MPGKFQINELGDGTYTFDLRDDGGEVLASSPVFYSRADAVDGIIAVIFTVPEAEMPPDIDQTMLHMH